MGAQVGAGGPLALTRAGGPLSKSPITPILWAFRRPVLPRVLEGRSIFRHLVASDAGPLRRLVIAGCAALSGLAAYAVFSAAAQVHAIDATVRSLNSQNSALQQQISDRRLQIGEANNVDWLEEQARRLGFVFPGESVYIITNPGSALPASGGINAVLPTYAPPTPTPTPGAVASASGSPSPATSAHASPTPLVFVMPSPSPTPH